MSNLLEIEGEVSSKKLPDMEIFMNRLKRFVPIKMNDKQFNLSGIITIMPPCVITKPRREFIIQYKKRKYTCRTIDQVYQKMIGIKSYHLNYGSK